MIDLTQGFILIIKILVLVLEVLYVVFAFILTRQIKLMNSSFTTEAAAFFKTFGFLHFVAAIILVAISAAALL